VDHIESAVEGLSGREKVVRMYSNHSSPLLPYGILHKNIHLVRARTGYCV
jgi:hypothetical protein